MKRLRPLCAWVLIASCQTPSEPPPEPEVAPAQPNPAAAREAVRSRRLPRTAACQGLSSDAQVGEASVLQVPASGTCKLLYPSGAVVVVHGPAEALVAPAAQAALVLGVGLVEVDLPAGALTPESGFWLALPGGELGLVEAGRVVARTLASGATQVALVSGRAALRGEGDARTLGAGQAGTLASSGDLAREASGPGTVQGALAWARAAQEPSGDRVAEAQRADAAFRAAEARIASVTQTLRDLERQHAQRVAQGDREAARRLQSEIAKQSGVLLALRRAWHARAASYLALRLPLDHRAHTDALAALEPSE